VGVDGWAVWMGGRCGFLMRDFYGVLRVSGHVRMYASRQVRPEDAADLCHQHLVRIFRLGFYDISAVVALFPGVQPPQNLYS